jgi:hypothetical protein
MTEFHFKAVVTDELLRDTSVSPETVTEMLARDYRTATLEKVREAMENLRAS